MTEPKLGGSPELRVAVLGGPDVASIISPDDGRAGFADAVAEAYGGEFTVELVGSPVESSRAILELLRSGGEPFDRAPDLVVLSVRPDIEVAVDPAEFRANMQEIIDTVKERFDARVIVFNVSTYDPADTTMNFAAIDSVLPHRIHQLDLEVMRLSVEQGISIIDVDRLLAELGAKDHVPSVMELSPRARDAVAGEFMRVVQEYGFFEKRPLLAQVGRGS